MDTDRTLKKIYKVKFFLNEKEEISEYFGEHCRAQLKQVSLTELS